MKILIADDDVVGRKILMIMLKSYGSCHQAVNSEEAITLFSSSLEEKQPYDIVFIEATLQGDDGWKILQALRQLENEAGIMEVNRVKCIMISTSATRKKLGDVIDEYKTQWDGYLSKPISPEILEKELQRLEMIKVQPDVFNRKQLATLINDVGDKAIVKGLVVNFIAELPKKLHEMQKYMRQAEYTYIQKMAHQMVSLSGTYGFSRLSEILRSIEQGAIRGEEQTIVDGLALALQQWRELQEPLNELLTDGEVCDGN